MAAVAKAEIDADLHRHLCRTLKAPVRVITCGTGKPSIRSLNNELQPFGQWLGADCVKSDAHIRGVTGAPQDKTDQCQCRRGHNGSLQQPLLDQSRRSDVSGSPRSVPASGRVEDVGLASYRCDSISSTRWSMAFFWMDLVERSPWDQRLGNGQRRMVELECLEWDDPRFNSSTSTRPHKADAIAGAV